MKKIQIKILKPDIVSDAPSYATSGSAGLDLSAAITDKIILKPGECILIGTGLAINIADSNYAAIILPRSGLGHKKGLVLGNGTGLIDSDYQGELMVSCLNRSGIDIEIEPMMRFAQLVIIPIIRVEFDLVDEFHFDTDRSTGGFGHTGV